MGKWLDGNVLKVEDEKKNMKARLVTNPPATEIRLCVFPCSIRRFPSG